jgi:Putative MetA-pathway of phenol degradation
MRPGSIFLAVILFLGTAAYSQVGEYFANWDNRVRETMSQQPSWVVPLVTDPSGIYQLLRVDFTREISSSGTTSWSIGDTKGLILIPWYKTELDLYAPPYLEYSSTSKNGFGDPEFQLKYRLAAADDTHGAYSINFAFAGTLPTGSYKNGSPNATVSPNLTAGKGFGRFDVQSQIGAELPVEAGSKLGRPITWNSVLQYHPGLVFWPEVEVNSTFYHGGPHDGKVQAFLLPGLMLDQFKLSHDPKNRLALLFGGGMQVAVTQYHSYNHGLVFTARLNF